MEVEVGPQGPYGLLLVVALKVTMLGLLCLVVEVGLSWPRVLSRAAALKVAVLGPLSLLVEM